MSSSDLFLQLKAQKFRYEIEYLASCLPAVERMEDQFTKLLEIYEEETKKFEKLSLEFHKFSEMNENCNKATMPKK